jgi:hypothetical protein
MAFIRYEMSQLEDLCDIILNTNVNHRGAFRNAGYCAALHARSAGGISNQEAQIMRSTLIKEAKIVLALIVMCRAALSLSLGLEPRVG